MTGAIARAFLVLIVPLFLMACGAEPKWADDASVSRAAYVHPGPPTLTLITAINNRSGEGGHSGLMVSGSQRVIFDPAGTWHHPTVPERNDVLYGINPTIYDFYIDYHARETYHVVIQELVVSPQIAAQALMLVQAHGAAPKATCGQSVSGILLQLGFSQVKRSYFPARIMRDFATIPGVRERKIYDDSPDSNADLLRYRQQNGLVAG
jgi:hypothetical protein